MSSQVRRTSDTMDTAATVAHEQTSEYKNMCCILWGSCFFVLLISSTIVFGIYPGFCGFVIPGTIGLVCCIIHLKREFLRRRRRGIEIASEETRNSGTAQVATYSENSPLITSSTSAPTATPRQVDRSNLHEPPPSYVEATKSQSRYPLATPTAHEASYSPPAYSQVRVWPS